MKFSTLPFPANRVVLRALSPLTVLALVILPVFAGTGDNYRFQHIALEDGLSQSGVMSMLQDHRGLMWFGTMDGLNRFDGYKFKVYKHETDKPGALSGDFIWDLHEDAAGRIWIGTNSGGLNRFDPKTDSFSHWRREDGLTHNRVSRLAETRDGLLWLGTQGGLTRFNPGNADMRAYHHDPEDPGSLSHDDVWALHADGAGRLWVGTAAGLNRMDGDFFQKWPLVQGESVLIRAIISSADSGHLWLGTDHGLFSFDPVTNSFTRFQPTVMDPQAPGLADRIRSLVMDKNGVLWLGSDGGGLGRFDPHSRRFELIRNRRDNPNGLSQDQITSLYIDQTGILWVGAFGAGLDKYDAATARFERFRRGNGRDGGLSNDMVKCIFEDRRGTCWIGTAGGLNRFDRKKNRFEVFVHQPDNPQSISDNDVRALFEDRRGVFWVGANGGLNRFDRDKNTFDQVPANPDKEGALSSEKIRSITEDRVGNLWFATDGGGLNRLDLETGRFNVFRHTNQAGSLSNDWVKWVHMDSGGKLWAGTSNGLNLYRPPSNDFEHFTHDKSRPDSISHNAVSVITEDLEGRLWVGTYLGVNRLSVDGRSFVSYREQDGLPNDVINGVLDDGAGAMWISTNRGLSRFDLKTSKFRNFGVDDGLQGTEFNAGAFFRDTRGQLFFGGTEGFNMFDPTAITDDPNPPPILLTELLIYNQEVATTTVDPDSPLSQPIFLADQVTLSYKDAVFSFEFAALHYANPAKNQYKYQMEGLDSTWIQTGADKRFATYTSLDSGDYTFRVKGSNKDGVWNDKGVSLRVSVLPPPWRTWWAYSLYALTLAGLVVYYLWSHKQKLAFERSVNEQLTELNRLKDEFLANTSHELRTPLNGIIGLAQSLRDGAAGNLSARADANLAMIVSSGKRLANLVNDILDFSRLKHHRLELNKVAVDLRAMTEIVLTLSKPLLGDKRIKLVNEVPPHLPPAYADENRLQQILYNLVGNAVKFTESGKVTVWAKQEDTVLWVGVKDTGIGIPDQKLEDIFQSFEQVDASNERLRGGTGLGLAVTRQLVELHDGNIQVESNVNEGTEFTFNLSVFHGKHEPTPIRGMPVVTLESEPALTLPTEEELEEPGAFHILIVDDEPVNRQVLVNYLSLEHYHITEAPGGEEALREINRNPHYDLLLLDVMMPRMSGFEVCRRLRMKYAALELPIIFLTAKSRVQDLVEGFATGANDYIIKPFEKNELLSRVKTHLQLLDFNRDLERKVADRTRDLVEAQKRLIDTAHMAGMAEIASSMLHEVGNSLNSTKISVHTLREEMENRQWLDLFSKILTLMEEQQDLAQFFAEDPRSERIGVALREILTGVNAAYSRVDHELGNLTRDMDLMENVMREQRRHVQFSKFLEPVDLNEVLSETLRMKAYLIEDKGIEVVFERGATPLVHVEKSKLARALVYLLKNAWEAIEAADRKDGRITIQTGVRNDYAMIALSDNGVGISQEREQTIFQHGFTTKAGEDNRGFGLHYCANVLKEMGGRIEVTGVGEFEGATFTLYLSLEHPDGD